MLSGDYRFVAREALRGRWPITILLTVVAVLLGADGSSGGSASFGNRDAASHSAHSFSFGWDWMMAYIVGLFSLFLFIYVLFCLIVGSSVELGLNLYNIRLVQRVEQQPFMTLFERFQIFGKALGLRLFTGLFVWLWMLLLIVPGIIAAYRYAMAPWLMAQYPEMGIREAVDRSKELMRGRKADLFFLHVSFIGWLILGMIPFGIGLLWVIPYMNAAEAAFYLRATGQLSYSR